MNIENKHDEIWIALAHIRIDRIRSSIKNADFAYVTVLGLAKEETDLEKKIAEALSIQNFKLLELEEVEKLSKRIEKFEIKSSILELAESLINGDIEVQFSTFHTYT